jgi:hypothetical protein
VALGNAGNDKALDDSSPSNLNDWDRAFGGTGTDTVYFVDGDVEDEISCGENILSPTPSGGDNDTANIDVVRDKPKADGGKIEFADSVHEEDSNGDSVTCETIKAKDQYGTESTIRDLDGTYEQLPPLESDETVAAVEPAA